MKSIQIIANAINNLASAINNLANKNTKPIINSTKTSNPYSGSVNVTSYSSSYSFDSLSAFEKEQLYYIYRTIIDKGINPNHHDVVYDKIMDKLNSEWPSLCKPIEKLVLINKRSVTNINPTTKDIWKNKHKH